MTRHLIVTALLLGMCCAAPARAGGPVYHDCVVIVLDASGSMGEMMPGTDMTKMAAAKAAIDAVVADVPQETYVGLLVFSGAGVPHEWLHPLTARDDETMLAALAYIRPDGGTPLGTYIKRGADALLQERKAQHGYGSYRLLLVTDGEADRGGEHNLMERSAPEILARGITMDVIGVNMDRQHTLATMAHSYANATDPSALTTAIREVFAEVQDRDAGDTSDTAFDVLAPVPDELALAMLDALSSSGNHPIGEAPPPPVVAQSSPVDGTTAHQPPPAQGSSTPSASACAVVPDGGPCSWLLALLGIVAVVARVRQVGRRP